MSRGRRYKETERAGTRETRRGGKPLQSSPVGERGPFGALAWLPGASRASGPGAMPTVRSSPAGSVRVYLTVTPDLRGTRTMPAPRRPTGAHPLCRRRVSFFKFTYPVFSRKLYPQEVTTVFPPKLSGTVDTRQGARLSSVSHLLRSRTSPYFKSSRSQAVWSGAGGSWTASSAFAAFSAFSASVTGAVMWEAVSLSGGADQRVSGIT